MRPASTSRSLATSTTTSETTSDAMISTSSSTATSCPTNTAYKNPRSHVHGALDAFGVTPERALMVGDTPAHDGGAAEVGIPTYLLPGPYRPGRPGPRGALPPCDSLAFPDRNAIPTDQRPVSNVITRRAVMAALVCLQQPVRRSRTFRVHLYFHSAFTRVAYVRHRKVSLKTAVPQQTNRKYRRPASRPCCPLFGGYRRSHRRFLAFISLAQSVRASSENAHYLVRRGDARLL
jgi:hypothetical protein